MTSAVSNPRGLTAAPSRRTAAQAAAYSSLAERPSSTITAPPPLAGDQPCAGDPLTPLETQHHHTAITEAIGQQRHAARARLAQAGYTPTVVAADAAHGYPDRAPYDRVLSTCGAFMPRRDYQRPTGFRDLKPRVALPRGSGPPGLAAGTSQECHW